MDGNKKDSIKISIRRKIAQNYWKLESITKEKEQLKQNRDNYLNQLKSLVNTNGYSNHCFTCDESISSATDQFCISCGWYKCSICKSCGCNYGSSSINFNYKKILSENKEANTLIDNIRSIEQDLRSIEENKSRIDNENRKYSLDLDYIDGKV